MIGGPTQKKTFYDQFSIAFSKPHLWEKCRDLSQILPMATPKELHTVFVQLCGDIFGYPAGGVGYGWNLPTLTRSSGSGYAGLGPNYRDFTYVLSFLGSNGPFLEAIHRLMPDPNHVYEFPVAQLPAGYAAQQNVMSLSTSHHHQSSVIGLSAFEYYFYHFSSLLVRRQQQNLAPTNVNVNAASDTIFPLLLEEYLNYFLPLSHSQQAKLFTQTFHLSPAASSPGQTTSHQMMTSHSSQLTSSSPVMAGTSASPPASSRPSLFRKDFSPQFASMPTTDHHRQVQSPRHQDFSLSHGGHHHTQAHSTTSNETWRSETLAKILIMFWIEGYVGDDLASDGSPGSPHGAGSSGGGGGGGSGSVNYISASLRMASTLPTTELMRAVRMVIKHGHYFANVCQEGSVYLPANLKMDIFGSSSSKATLLAFFSRSIDHWPYDASFRIVLETWLSYIQPWRYTSGGVDVNAGDQNEDSGKMEPVAKWSGFVSDNYPFYSQLMAKVLSRFRRLDDLGSSKNAFMLFRVFKVLTQDNLFPCIKEVGSIHGQGLVDKDNIFSQVFKERMTDLIVASAKGIGNEKKKMSLEHKPAKKDVGAVSKVVTFVYGLFNGDSSSASSSDSELAESKKTITHLEFVAEKAAVMFGLQTVLDNCQSLQESRRGSTQADIDQIDNKGGLGAAAASGLSPEQRRGLLNKKLKPDGRYKGNPDKLPIRSDEFAFLVRPLFRASSWVNQKYGDKIEEFYGRDTYFGALFREFCAEPAVYYSNMEFDELDSSLNTTANVHWMPKKSVKLPPRISFRYLGSYRFIAYLFIFFFLSMVIFGKTFTGACFGLLFNLTFFYGFKAFSNPTNPECYPKEPPSLLSESFT